MNKYYWIGNKIRGCTLKIIETNFKKKAEVKIDPANNEMNGFIIINYAGTEDRKVVLVEFTDIKTQETFLEKTDIIIYWDNEIDALNAMIKKYSNVNLQAFNDDAKDIVNTCTIQKRLLNLDKILEFAI